MYNFENKAKTVGMGNIDLTFTFTFMRFMGK